MFRKLAILLAVFLPAIALAGGPVNPPGPTPITCTGGNSVTAYSGYGQPLTCGTALATGTINTGTAGQLADYTAATTIGPITTGTGVVTALGVNTGSAGAFLVNGGVLGTPSSGTLTNATGLPISTGVSGLGTGVATFLATPSSANLLSALTTKTGTGLAVFGTSPTLSGLTLSDVATGTQCLHANSSGVVSGTGVDCGAGGGGAFSSLTGGTNTSAAMVVGTGASLATSGSGTIAATSVPNTAVTAGSYTNTNLTVAADGRITAASNGTGGSGGISTVTDGTHTQTSTTTLSLGTGLLTTTGSGGTAPLSLTNAQNSPTDSGTHSYTVLSSDLVKEVILANTFTALSVPQATGSFGAGSSFTNVTKSAVTATPTTSTVNGLSSIKIGANQFTTWDSDGTNWLVGLGVPQPATQTGTTFLRDDMTWQTPAGGTGSGLDSGYTRSSVTGTGTISSEVTVIGSGWTTGTLTLPAISGSPAPYCILDAAQNISGTATLTIAANAADSIGGGTSGGSIGPFTTAASGICLRPAATHNWTVESSNTQATSTLAAHNFANQLTVNGLAGAQPAFTDISGTNSAAQIAGSAASHAVPVDVAGTPTWKVVPDCQDSGGNHLNYTQSTDAYSCGTTSSGGGGGTPKAYITGLIVTKHTAANTLDISAGEAYDPSASALLTCTAQSGHSAGTLGASQWNQVYVYTSSGCQYEIVNNADPPSTTYVGNAARQGGTHSGRWIGGFLTDGSSNIINVQTNESAQGELTTTWLASATAAPFRVLSAGTATSYTSVSLSGAVPKYACSNAFMSLLSGLSAGAPSDVVFSISVDGTNEAYAEEGYVLTTSTFPRTSGYFPISPGSAPAVFYLMGGPGSANAVGYIDVAGYRIAR